MLQRSIDENNGFLEGPLTASGHDTYGALPASSDSKQPDDSSPNRRDKQGKQKNAAQVAQFSSVYQTEASASKTEKAENKKLLAILSNKKR